MKNYKKSRILALISLGVILYSCQENDEITKNRSNPQMYSPSNFDEESRNLSIESAQRMFSLKNKNENVSFPKTYSFLSKGASNTEKYDTSVIATKNYIEGGKLELLKNGTFFFTPDDIDNLKNDYALHILYRKESNIRSNTWHWEPRTWIPSANYKKINEDLANLRSSNGEYFVYIQQFNWNSYQWELLNVANSDLYPAAARFLITQSITGSWGIDKINSKVSVFHYKNCPLTIENNGDNFLGSMEPRINGEVDFTFDFTIPPGNYPCEGADLPLLFPVSAYGPYIGTYDQTFLTGTPSSGIKPYFNETTSIISNGAFLNVLDTDGNPLEFGFIIEPMTAQEYEKYSMKLSLREPITVKFDILTATFEEGTVFFKEIE